jgi:hypothetical protein
MHDMFSPGQYTVKLTVYNALNLGVRLFRDEAVLAKRFQQGELHLPLQLQFVLT